ncbi:MAG: hypothetical protein QXG17_03340 [Sulfolobales archaeon]
MSDTVRKAVTELVKFIKGVRQALVEGSVSALEEEFIELESAYLLLVLGPLVGVKTITPLLSLELLEPLSAELRILESRAFKGEDVLADLMAALGGEW